MCSEQIKIQSACLTADSNPRQPADAEAKRQKLQVKINVLHSDEKRKQVLDSPGRPGKANLYRLHSAARTRHGTNLRPEIRANQTAHPPHLPEYVSSSQSGTARPGEHGQ